MNDVYKKPCIFITGLGRTGTHFFGYRMSRMIENCTSVHEPDVLHLFQPHEWCEKIREFGFFRMTFGKLMARYSLRALGVARRAEQISDSQAIQWLQQVRLRSLERMRTQIYLESNLQCGALVDLLPLALPNCRVVYVIRDPRFWVHSWMSKKRFISLYGQVDYISWLKNGRLTPYHLASDPYRSKWARMSRFEKLCWSWAASNSFGLVCVGKTEAAKVYRFEDLFEAGMDNRAFPEMLQFITTFPNGVKANWEFKPELLSEKLGSTSGGTFPEWTAWSDEQIQQLHRHCRVLMERFNYGNEEAWKERLGQANGSSMGRTGR